MPYTLSMTIRLSALKNLLACASLFTLLVVLLTPGVMHAQDRKNILILNSYHPGYKWTDDETIGALKALEPVKNTVTTHVEYMGTKWVQDTRPYLERLRGVYRQKFQAIPMSVIIATDNDAFDFLLRYRDEIFGRVPVVFCGVNWFREDSLKGKALFTGVNEDADIKATIDLMLKLHPTTKQIMVIVDTTTTGAIVREKLLELTPQYTDRVRFQVLRDLTIQEIIDRVASAPPDSLALMTVFQKDAAGKLFEYAESTSLISNASRVPVYGLWDFNLDAGIVGGKLTSGQEQGRNAGAMALRILMGESWNSIPVLMQSPNRYMFDFRQMERFGISTATLPKDSIIINEPTSFYAVHKTLLIGIAFGFAGLSAIIVVLLINIRQRKHAETALQKAHDELELRVQERTVELDIANRNLMRENADRRQAEQKLKELSEKDDLTGIFNRRKLFDLLKYEISKAERYHRPLSLVMFDLDHFKMINDTFGHSVGDDVLVTAADVVCRTIRDIDIFARYGGEEFVVLCPETDLAGALSLAEKIRQAMESHAHRHGGSVTISAGVSAFIAGDTKISLIKRADDALYRAKSNGRNRVEE